MPVTDDGSKRRPPSGAVIGLGLAAVALLAAMWLPVVRVLVSLYKTDQSLSHAPLVLLIAAAHLWMKRDALRSWTVGAPAGLAVMGAAGLLHVVAVWSDTEFLKSASLIVVGWGMVWFLAGGAAARATAGVFGFLFFIIPWPTTVVERIAFPLQLNSSAYAAMLSGILGCPVVRTGVHLAVVPPGASEPIYSIFVARQCSGLTSMLVLLTLGYLIAYHTPVRLGWRALLVATVIPIAILANALRLTFILLAGARHGAAVAKWVHDNEAPVLVFFCSLLLIGIRQAILMWCERSTAPEAPAEASAAPDAALLSERSDDQAVPTPVG